MNMPPARRFTGGTPAPDSSQDGDSVSSDSQQVGQPSTPPRPDPRIEGMPPSAASTEPAEDNRWSQMLEAVSDTLSLPTQYDPNYYPRLLAEVQRRAKEDPDMHVLGHLIAAQLEMYDAAAPEEIATGGAVPAPIGPLKHAEWVAEDALDRGYGIEEAVKRGLGYLREFLGDPSNYPSDVEELRRHVEQVAASGGPRAPSGCFDHAKRAVENALGQGANVEEALTQGMNTFEEIAGAPLRHSDDLAELRQYAEQLAANGRATEH